MNTRKTFKADQPRTDVLDWIEGTLVEVIGDSAPTLGTRVRITIELVKADELAIEPILELFGLKDARAEVLEFIAYRRDDRRDTMTLEGVRRLLRPFSGQVDLLKRGLRLAIDCNWKGLKPEWVRESSAPASREFKSDGRKGGSW